MKVKNFLCNTLVSTLLLTSSYSAFAQNHASQQNMAQTNVAQMVSAGEIIGSFNSPDGTVVGATLPGKEVMFKISIENNKPQYLHFAFMHAASAQNGWYFAPKSEHGIQLKMLKHGQIQDITNEIALFQAPNAQTSSPVTMSTNQLKAGKANQFMKATVMQMDGYYIVKIKNTSMAAYETPFSSGVWSISHHKMKAFDHIASAALATLATSGHRAPLYESVKNK